MNRTGSSFGLPPALVFMDSRLESLSERLRSRPVASLSMGARATNVLESAGACSVGDLVDAVQKGLPAYRGLGASSFDEISFVLESLVKKTGKKNNTFEARYSAFGRRIFFFRAQGFKRISHYQLNRPVSELGLGREALAFAGGRCLASSLGRFLEKCAEGIRGIRCEDARPIPEIVHSLHSLTRSVSDEGRVNWRVYRRLSGLNISPELKVAVTGVTRTDNVAGELSPSAFSVVLVHYPGHYARVHFEFPELSSLSEKSKQLDLEPLLSRRPFNIYSSMDVCTFGALVELASKGFRQIPGYGRKCYTETEALLRAAASIIDGNGDVDPEALCKAVRRPFIPVGDTSSRDVLDAAISALFPVLCYTSPKLQQLSKSAKREHVHNLHLDSRAATTMESLGVADVGGFVDTLKQGINANKLRNFGRKAFNDLLAALTALSSSIDSKGECSWMAYASARGFKVLSSEAIDKPRQVVEQMADIFEQAIEAQFRGQKDSRRQMDVFKGRLHSPIDAYLTLEQLGTRHKLSRERIRQNEMHIARCISAPILLGCYSVPVIRSKGKSYEGLRFRFRPAVESTLQSANAALNAEGRKVWRLDDWVQFLSQLWNADPRLVERNALLLSVLFRFSLEAQTVDGETKGFLLVSEAVPIAVKQEFRELLKVIHLSMQGSAEGLSTAEILAPLSAAKVLKGLALEAEDLMALSPAVFPIKLGVWKIKPEFYKPKVGKLTCDAVYEILSENGSRMHNSQLLRRFKLRHPDLLESDRLLTVRMFLDPRFRPIGRSGYWVLAEWKQETGTIREVIAKVLEEAEGPMHINDILRVVRMRVPCKETSIRAYLAESPEQYIKLSSVTYGWASRYPNRLRHEDD